MTHPRIGQLVIHTQVEITQFFQLPHVTQAVIGEVVPFDGMHAAQGQRLHFGQFFQYGQIVIGQGETFQKEPVNLPVLVAFPAGSQLFQSLQRCLSSRLWRRSLLLHHGSLGFGRIVPHIGNASDCDTEDQQNENLSGWFTHHSDIISDLPEQKTACLSEFPPGQSLA